MKRLAFLITLALMLSLGLLATPVAETTEANSGNWTSMTSNTGKILYAVWGSSSTDVFAVGQDGTILHYDGSGWTAMDSGFTYDLYGVWGSSSSDIYAVGYGGTILHCDGTEWTIMIQDVIHEHFQDVWGSCATDVFAVGGGFSHGSVLHYSGISWTPMPSEDAPWLYGIWGTSGSDVFAVGKGTIMHSDGLDWSVISRCGGTNFLYDIWGSSSANIFVMGANGIIIQYDGSSWAPVAEGIITGSLRSVWGSSPTDVYAVGDGGAILHYDGIDWTAMNSGTAWRLNGVWGSSLTDVFAVGYYGTILHYGAIPTECVPTTTETGTACFITSDGVIEHLTAVATPPNCPAALPHGLFSFNITGLAAGQNVTITVELPDPVPLGTKWWKYQNGSWYWLPIGSDDGDNIVTVTLQDGVLPGDEDSIAGQITDDGGPGNSGAVGWETYPINKVRVLLPWIALVGAIIAGLSLLVLGRRRSTSDSDAG